MTGINVSFHYGLQAHGVAEIALRRIRGVRAQMHISSDCYVGVDIGGTWVRIILANREKVLVEVTQQTKRRGTERAVSDQLKQLIRLALSRANGDIFGLNTMFTVDATQDERLTVNNLELGGEILDLCFLIGDALGIIALNTIAAAVNRVVEASTGRSLCLSG
jgi:hypothetical protein